MKKEIYTAADDDIREALLMAKVVDDFLPPPSELQRKHCENGVSMLESANVLDDTQRNQRG